MKRELSGLCLVVLMSFAQANAIERGKNDFFYYCSGCHSLQYVGSDLLTKEYRAPEPWQKFLVSGKWLSFLSQNNAEAWFGRRPPDLSLITLTHSQSWLSRYLKSFNRDPRQEWGCNNSLLPYLRMPDVLSGELDRAKIADDIASFLSYAAEPNAEKRKMIGSIVLLFAGIGLILARMLKKAYKV